MSSGTLEKKRACILAPTAVIHLPEHFTEVTHWAQSGQFKTPASDENSFKGLEV